MSDYIGRSDDGSGQAINPSTNPDDPLAAKKFNDLLSAKHGSGESLSASDEMWLSTYRNRARLKISDSTKEEVQGFLQVFKDFPAAVADLFEPDTIEELGRQDAARLSLDEMKDERRSRKEDSINPKQYSVNTYNGEVTDRPFFDRVFDALGKQPQVEPVVGGFSAGKVVRGDVYDGEYNGLSLRELLDVQELKDGGQPSDDTE